MFLSIVRYMIIYMIAFSFIFPVEAMEEVQNAGQKTAFNQFKVVFDEASNAQDYSGIRESKAYLVEAANLGHPGAEIILQQVEYKDMMQRIGDLGKGMLLAGFCCSIFLYYL